MTGFAVVEFTDSQTVEIIPTKWLSKEEDTCFWPPVKSCKVLQLVKDQQEASNAWKKHAVRVLGIAVSYERAREKLSRAEETSDINTDCERKRKRKAARRYSSGDTSSDSERVATMHFPVPAPPQSLVLNEPAKKKVKGDGLIKHNSGKAAVPDEPVQPDEALTQPSPSCHDRVESALTACSSPFTPVASVSLDYSTPNVAETTPGAVTKNPLLKTTVKDVELAVSRWLTGARDRGGRKMERSKAEKQKRDASAAADDDGLF